MRALGITILVVIAGTGRVYIVVFWLRCLSWIYIDPHHIANFECKVVSKDSA